MLFFLRGPEAHFVAFGGRKGCQNGVEFGENGARGAEATHFRRHAESIAPASVFKGSGVAKIDANRKKEARNRLENEVEKKRPSKIDFYRFLPDSGIILEVQNSPESFFEGKKFEQFLDTKKKDKHVQIRTKRCGVGVMAGCSGGGGGSYFV